MHSTASAVATAALPPAPTPTPRYDAVDLLRGFVMVLMAIDHTRDFLHSGQLHGFDPLDLKTTTVALFLTRWITHYCAPVFIFLAGTGAFLSGRRGKTRGQLSWFLLTRGLWLVLLELTYVSWCGWMFQVNVHFGGGYVIWAIGWSMIVLAGLVHLPVTAVAAFGVTMIATHNAFDGVAAESWGRFAWLWRVLHAGGPIEPATGFLLYIGYPLIPWMGVMAAGYGFGALLQRDNPERRRLVLRLGLALTIGFVVLRGLNIYGDPKPWIGQSNLGRTLLGMLDCRKYPPSLCYLLMTLGPALIVLAALDRPTPRVLRPLLVFGRVPMFYYLLHLPLIHGIALAIQTAQCGSAPWLFGNPFGPRAVPVPPKAGLGLAGVYGVWLVVILLLYPACRRFAQLKQQRRSAWLSYL